MIGVFVLARMWRKILSRHTNTHTTDAQFSLLLLDYLFINDFPLQGHKALMHCIYNNPIWLISRKQSRAVTNGIWCGHSHCCWLSSLLLPPPVMLMEQVLKELCVHRPCVSLCMAGFRFQPFSWWNWERIICFSFTTYPNANERNQTHERRRKIKTPSLKTTPCVHWHVHMLCVPTTVVDQADTILYIVFTKSRTAMAKDRDKKWRRTNQRTNDRSREDEKWKKKHNKQTNKTRKFPVILSRHSVVTKTLLCMRVFYPKGLPYARHTTVS